MIAGAITMPIKARAIKRSCIVIFSSQGFLQLANSFIFGGIRKILNSTKNRQWERPVPWCYPT